MTPNAQAENFGPSISQRLAPSISRFSELADVVAQGLRVAMPAVVAAFRSGPPAVVDVQIAMRQKVQLNANGPSGPINMQVQYQQIGGSSGGLITDIPVVWPGGGGMSITFPVAPGDECLLVVGDGDWESWFVSGGVGNIPQRPSRHHDFTDSFAFVGLRSKPRSLPSYSAVEAELRTDDGTVVIGVSKLGVSITGPSVTVNATNATLNAQTALVQVTGDLAVTADSVAITGQSGVTIDGNGNTVIDGKQFTTHKHTGVQTGGGSTGPVL